jgi:anti-anti-sigma factor
VVRCGRDYLRDRRRGKSTHARPGSRCATIAPLSAMRVDHTRFVDVVVLAPIGRVDHATAEALKAALAPHLARCAQGQDHLVLDLSGVDYISSAGLRVLMLAAKQAKAQGGFLAVAAVQSTVQEILEISKFTLLLRLMPTVREAVAAASPTALAAFDRA